MDSCCLTTLLTLGWTTENLTLLNIYFDNIFGFWMVKLVYYFYFWNFEVHLALRKNLIVQKFSNFWFCCIWEYFYCTHYYWNPFFINFKFFTLNTKYVKNQNPDPLKICFRFKPQGDDQKRFMKPIHTVKLSFFQGTFPIWFEKDTQHA